MPFSPVDLTECVDRIKDLWSPRIVAQVNDYHVKLARIQGPFVWHSHDNTNELFFVISGSLRIEMRDGHVNLNEGQMFVVPRGVEHRPVAGDECHILLFEPAGTCNTGASDNSEFLSTTGEWDDAT